MSRSPFQARARVHLGFALLSSLLAVPAGAAEPTSGIFREWLAGCDNLGRCTALSLPVDGASFPAMQVLQREAGPASPPVLALTLKAGNLPELPLVANLTVDGAPFPTPGAKLTVERADLETGRVRFKARIQDVDARHKGEPDDREARLEPFPIQLDRTTAPAPCCNAFSSSEPVPTSLESDRAAHAAFDCGRTAAE